MELKKSPSANLENKKGLFLEIGLTISLLFIIGMFSWNQKEKVIKDYTPPAAIFEEEMIDITVQEEKKPEQQETRAIQATTDILKVVSNDATITTEFDFSTEFSDVPIEIVQPKVTEETVAPENVPILKAEVMPKFQGQDYTTFRDWVQKNAVYPELAKNNNIQGTVTLSFVVNTNGEVVDIEIISSPDRMLSDAAIRTVRSSPKWTPGMQKNRPQAVKMNIPVKFELR